MIELYLSKVTDSSESEQAGKLYARVSYKQTLDVQAMARHMAEHNTMFSEGSITGILIDFVKCRLVSSRPWLALLFIRLLSKPSGVLNAA